VSKLNVFNQKTKNYRVILAGLKGGLKTSLKLGGWTLAFVGLQEGLFRGLDQSGFMQGKGEKGLSGAIAAGNLTLLASKMCEHICPRICQFFLNI